MNFEPQKLFIGLIDFFSILMPGALLTFLGMSWAVGLLHLHGGKLYTGSEGTFIFLFCSYLLGHFVFLLSSTLDDWVYDRFRRLTDDGQVSHRLAVGKDLAPRWIRKVAHWKVMFGRNADNAVNEAVKMKVRTLSGIASPSSVNAFQWCKARLVKDSPEGLLVVHRFEADSKFFRSFVFVLAILSIFYGAQRMWLPMNICLVAIVPAMWRYIDQRYKSTEQAYYHVITLEAAKLEPPRIVMRSDGLTHAGAVVTKGHAEKRQYLLIEAGANRNERVLPKGHIEPGEDPRVTAIREVREETGHWARFLGWIEDSRLSNQQDAPYVRWFILELAEEGKAQRPEDRQGFWMSREEAVASASFVNIKNLIEKADLQINQLEIKEKSSNPSYT